MQGFRVWLEDQVSHQALRQHLADLWRHREDQLAIAKFIHDNIDQIIADTGANWGNPSALLQTIELVQYMDDPRMVPFRNWFTNELQRNKVNAKNHPNYKQFQFLNTSDDANLEGPFAKAYEIALKQFKLGKTSYPRSYPLAKC